MLGKVVIPWAGCDCWAGSFDMFTVCAVQGMLDGCAANSTMIEIFMWFEPLKSGDLNPNVVADVWGSAYFKCQFLHLVMLSIIFHAFLKLKTSN
jgi:hypothetical protein